MRSIAFALCAIACSQQPQQRRAAVPQEGPGDENIRAPSVADAFVAVPTIDAEERDPSDTRKVADYLDTPVGQGDTAAQPDAGAPTADEPVDPNADVTTEENGVTVVSTTRPPKLCATKGGAGVCESTPGQCKREKMPCVVTKNFACFSGTVRTSGKEVELCFPSYASCEALRIAVTDSPETASATDCVIYRVRPKVRAPKKSKR